MSNPKQPLTAAEIKALKADKDKIIKEKQIVKK